MTVRMIMVLRLFLLLATVTTHGLQCLSEISTDGQWSKVSCRALGFIHIPDRPIQSHVPIINLDLSNNYIVVLHEGALAAFPKLRRLDVSNNRVYKITDHAFRALTELEHLSLRGNQLSIGASSLVSACWQWTLKLRWLDLSENPLGPVPSGFFMSLRQLYHLQLDYITSTDNFHLHPGALKGLDKLTNLTLIGNNMSELPETLFNPSVDKHLQDLRLGDNPWHCDCNLAWITQWYRSLNRTKRRDVDELAPQCASPDHLRGEVLLGLPLNRLQCVPELLTSPTTQRVRQEEGTSVSLSCHFCVRPSIEAIWLYNGKETRRGIARSEPTNENCKHCVHYHIANLTRADSGRYECLVQNWMGQVRASYTLFVQPTPVASSTLSNATRIAVICLLLFGICGISCTPIGLYYCYHHGFWTMRSKHRGASRSVSHPSVDDASLTYCGYEANTNMDFVATQLELVNVDCQEVVYPLDVSLMEAQSSQMMTQLQHTGEYCSQNQRGEIGF